jgi:hypothetical protein
MSNKQATVLGIILASLASALIYYLTGQPVQVTVDLPQQQIGLPADVTPCAAPEAVTLAQAVTP